MGRHKKSESGDVVEKGITNPPERPVGRDVVDGTPAEDKKEKIRAALEGEPEKKPRGIAAKRIKEEEAAIASEEEMKQFLGVFLDAMDAGLTKAGLTPMNPVQRMLISVGTVGTMKKYGLSMNEYPEVFLGAGVVWTGYDKFIEWKKAHPHDTNGARKEGSRKDNAGEDPAPKAG